jgi:hypothetical protein
LAAVAILVAGPALADNSDLIETRGPVKAKLMRAMDLGHQPECWSVALSKSNHSWAIVSPTTACGPNSGHSRIFQKSGHKWKYLFYDMQNDGCDVFKMPASVRRDFSPYVC